MNGNTGKIIEVDLTRGDIEITHLPEAVYKKYVGGSGLGAVMGAKNLKAIVVRGTHRSVKMADPEQFEGLRTELNPRIREGAISEVLHDFGTAGSLEGHVYDGDVPIRNWTSNFWEEMAEALTGSTLEETYLTGRKTCAFCTIACKRVVEVKDGPFAVPEGPGPEYETIVSFGALLGAMDLTAMKARFYELIGLDPEKGIPLKETLLKYHMADEAAFLRFPGGYQ